MTHSSANRNRQELFGSPAWIEAWTLAWGDTTAVTPLPVADLPGIFSSFKKLKGIIPVSTAAPVGVSFGEVRSMRSEYFFFASEPAASQSIISNFLSATAEKPWDQLYLPDIPQYSNELPLLQAAAESLGWDMHVQDESLAYGINCRSQDFESYLQQLGKNSRLQLFNRRKKLEQLGEVCIKNVWPDIHYFMDVINQFHQSRWQKPVFSHRNRVFIEQLLPALAAQGHTIDLSLMCLNNKPLAAILDLHVNGRVYNLQSGFASDFGHKISLGSIHFGFKIEDAFNQSHIDYYDFMAGTGKNSDYKKQFATDSTRLLSIALVRSAWLKHLYRLRNRLKRKNWNFFNENASLLFCLHALGNL